MIISESIKIGIYWKIKTDQKTNFETPISNFYGSRALKPLLSNDCTLSNFVKSCL